jgi:formylglycine-generating enzyme required for sulfatase activity
VTRFLNAAGLVATLLWAGFGIEKSAVAQSSTTDMKPYSETIPGTEISFEMVPIPSGSFEMGSPESEAKRGDDEGPVHPVEINAFWMGAREVTWDEFDQFAFSLDIKKKKREGVDITKQADTETKADAVTRPTPPYADMTFGHGHDGQPALCMTHHAAMEYCRWLSAKTGKIYRLPTEAEWEYACRAGTKTAYSWGDDPTQFAEYGWDVENAEKPMPVGKKKPNPWGLFDMHGNVAEWCIDHYVGDIYKTYPSDKPVKGPVVLPTAKEYSYVVRGGSWDLVAYGRDFRWLPRGSAGFGTRQLEGREIAGGQRKGDALRKVPVSASCLRVELPVFDQKLYRYRDDRSIGGNGAG